MAELALRWRVKERTKFSAFGDPVTGSLHHVTDWLIAFEFSGAVLS